MKLRHELPTTPEIRTLLKSSIFCSLGALGIAASSIMYREVLDSDEVRQQSSITIPQVQESTLPKSLEAVEENSHQPLQNLHAIIINNPNYRPTEDLAEIEIQQRFETAGKLMYESSDGVLIMPKELPVTSVNHIPSGKLHDVRSTDYCFTGDDIEDARQEALLKDGLSLSTRTAIIVNGDPTCKNDAAGWATRSRDGAEMTVYNQDPTVHLIAHEEGHVAGLPHASTIDCPVSDGQTQISMQERSLTDIGELLTTEGCARPLNEDGEVDEYSSENSVMGNKDVTDIDTELYNFVEVNKLSPDTVRIKDVKPLPASYEIGNNETDLRGIRFKLPKGHPLKKVDPSLTRLNIGIEPTGNGRYEVDVVASGEGISYDLSYSYPLMSVLDKDKEVLYKDEHLQIQVSGQYIKHTAPDKVLLRVDTIRQ